MAKALENGDSKKLVVPGEKAASRHAGVPKTGAGEPNKQSCGPADDKQMQRLLRHCAGVIAAKFADWQWYTK